MIPFNVILILSRFLLRFRLVNKFKPFIDAYQGAYKDKCYYWTGLQLLMRAIFLGLSSLERNVNLKISIILIFVLVGIHGLLHPFRSKKMQNFQEFIWLINLFGLHVLSLYSQGTTNVMHVNILVIIAMVHFSIIMVYHIITYTWIGKVTSSCALTRCLKVYNFFKIHKLVSVVKVNDDREMNEIADVTYKYHEYQEPLIGL